MAPKKGSSPAKSPLAPVIAAANRLASRIPFLPKRPAASHEPFSAIEDDTPLGDLLSSANAAPAMARQREGAEERPDYRALAESAVASAVKNPPALAAIVIVLVFILALAVTAIIVAVPPKAPRAAAPFTAKGEALVKSWLPAPGDPLAPRMAFEREGAPAYTAADAARLGIKASPPTLARLRDQSDASIEDLYGTAP